MEETEYMAGGGAKGREKRGKGWRRARGGRVGGRGMRAEGYNKHNMPYFPQACLFTFLCINTDSRWRKKGRGEGGWVRKEKEDGAPPTKNSHSPLCV